MTAINTESIFYHIYPLGACGAPQVNNFSDAPVPRLRAISGWLDHIQGLGANAIYLGPVFESSTHGYDTANYYEVDRRLGNREDLAWLSGEIHARGMRLVLDGVFNHVGRGFWAFADLRRNLTASPYQDWFANLRFDQRSPIGDPFTYEAWSGHFDLVKLNLANPAVMEHLFGAVRLWNDAFGIDGIRLDAADALSADFMRSLRAFTDSINPNLWLMGEVIHGDYRQWANPQMLHSTTNYELYKSLYSAHNDNNYFELAHSLKRQFGEGGIYTGLDLYTFVDNHDVTRIASQLKDRRDLYPVHLLHFCVPGLPSIYYGSEFGLSGVKTEYDWHLRPYFDLPALEGSPAEPDLPACISRLSGLKAASRALQQGSYFEKLVAPNQFAFLRSWGDEHVVVAVNNADSPIEVNIPMTGMAGWRFEDVLNGGENYWVGGDAALKLSLPPKWGRVLINK